MSCYTLIGYVRVSRANEAKSSTSSVTLWSPQEWNGSASTKTLPPGDSTTSGLNACLKALRPDDTLVVWKLDRLGRNLKHLVNVEDLSRQEIGFRVITDQGANIDTTTSNGRLVFGIFASLAEFERELLAEKTKASLAAARARGRCGPRKMDRATSQMTMAAMSDGNSVAKDIAKRLGITTTRLYEYANGDGSLKAAGTKIMKTPTASSTDAPLLNSTD